MFFFGDIVQFCYLDKKNNQYLCHIGIYPWFFLRFFFKPKGMGPCGAPKIPKKPQKGPPRVSFEADNLKFLDSIKVFDGLNQKQKDTASPVNVTVFFFHKRALFFFGAGKSRWMKSIEPFERFKIQDFEYLYLYIYI